MGSLSHQPCTGATLPARPRLSWLAKNELAGGQASPSQTPGGLPGDNSLLTAKMGIKAGPLLPPGTCSQDTAPAEPCRCICRAPAPGIKTTALKRSLSEKQRWVNSIAMASCYYWGPVILWQWKGSRVEVPVSGTI